MGLGAVSQKHGRGRKREVESSVKLARLFNSDLGAVTLLGAVLQFSYWLFLL